MKVKGSPLCSWLQLGISHGITDPQFVRDDSRADVVNPGYSKYIQQNSSLASSQVSKGMIGCMTATSIWQNLHRDFSLLSTTPIMHLYDRLKARKFVHQSMRDYETEIHTAYDCLSSCCHPISQMQ